MENLNLLCSLHLGHYKVCYTRYKFLIQLVSQRPCNTSTRRIAARNSAFNMLSQVSLVVLCERVPVVVRPCALNAFLEYFCFDAYRMIISTDMIQRLRIKDTTWFTLKCGFTLSCEIHPLTSTRENCPQIRRCKIGL